MKKTCLVTGPEIETWPDNCNLRLLGDFCINDSNSRAITKRKYTVVKMYGDDPDTRAKDKIYVENLYERLLLSLSSSLNINHNVNYPIRYWRILIGPWLNAIIPVLYNRWNKIDVTLNSSFNEITSARYPIKSIIPYNMSDFGYIHLRSEWNSDLFSRILEFRKIDFQPYDYGSSDMRHIQENKKSFVGTIKGHLVNLIQLYFL